jgi:hypothetical protein
MAPYAPEVIGTFSYATLVWGKPESAWTMSRFFKPLHVVTGGE